MYCGIFGLGVGTACLWMTLHCFNFAVVAPKWFTASVYAFGKGCPTGLASRIKTSKNPRSRLASANLVALSETLTPGFFGFLSHSSHSPYFPTSVTCCLCVWLFLCIKWTHPMETLSAVVTPAAPVSQWSVPATASGMADLSGLFFPSRVHVQFAPVRQENKLYSSHFVLTTHRAHKCICR